MQTHAEQQTARISQKPEVTRARRKFLRYYPRGFADPLYQELERNLKWLGHRRWNELLSASLIDTLIETESYAEVCHRALEVESVSRLLLTSERRAIQDAVSTPAAARTFAVGLRDLLHGHAPPDLRFNAWCDGLDELSPGRSRILTWPMATVWAFLAQPARHMLLKPQVMQIAASRLNVDFHYRQRPDASTYGAFMGMGARVRQSVSDWRPRDYIDIQSYLWVQGSAEYD